MELAGTDTILFGSHFPSPTAGTLVTEGQGYKLIPLAGRL